MSNIIALDWDAREARIVIATTRGENARVAAALTLPLAPVSDADEAAEEEREDGADSKKARGERSTSVPAKAQVAVKPDPRLGEQLRDVFKKHRQGRGPVLVGVDRGSVELVHLTLPPAADTELAELVHNQIVRELHVSPEDGVVDFLPMSTDPEKPRAVTAALLTQAHLDRLRQTCAAANIVPKRFLLRAFAAASLFSRTASPPEDICLLANRIGDEVDLTVLERGNVVFSRTIRLPTGLDETVLIERLTADVKRTIAVSMQNTADASPVEGVYLFGGPNEYQHLIETIQEELGVAAMVIDPFVAVDNTGQVPPQNAGEFAPLLGMILDEVRGGTHAIDFLNPRQEPKPPNRNRLYAGIAAAVLVVASAGGFYVWDRIETVKEENSVVYAEMRELEKLVQSGKTKERMVTAVREWQAADICWLDELRDLALRLPSSRDMVLHKMTLAPARGGGGSVSYFGQVRDPSIVLRMENAVRDSFHAIESRRVQERQGEKDYTWRFETSMTVARRAAEEYTSHLPKRPEEDSRTALNPSTDEAKPSAGARSEESSKRPAGEEVSASQSATTLNPPGGAAQSPPTTRAGVLGAGFKTPRASDKRSAPAGGTQPREAPGEVDVENTPQTSDEQAGGPGEAALSRATETSK